MAEDERDVAVATPSARRGRPEWQGGDGGGRRAAAYSTSVLTNAPAPKAARDAVATSTDSDGSPSLKCTTTSEERSQSKTFALLVHSPSPLTSLPPSPLSLSIPWTVTPRRSVFPYKARVESPRLTVGLWGRSARIACRSGEDAS